MPSARSAHDYVVPARGKELIKTDIAICVPHGTYGRVAPRSGLAWKNFIDTGAGVIDEDYRGNVGVILFNHSDQDFVGAWGLNGATRTVPCCVMSRPHDDEEQICRALDQRSAGTRLQRSSWLASAALVTSWVAALLPPAPKKTLCSTTTVKRGDRVAQLVLERIAIPEVAEVEDLDSTDRGAGGFGSTGVSKQ